MAEKEKADNALEINVENIGPVGAWTIKLPHYGVTVMTAPNGRGKSILLDACQSLARGEGKPPLKRGEERGRIEGMGARITLSAKSTRHTGEFQVQNLEGRFDLSQLPEPGLKDPVAADKRRIKVLLNLTGVTGSPDLWARRPEFDTEELAELCADALDIPDITEQAARIARDYQQAARTWEKMARDDDKRADGIESTLEEIDEHVVTDLNVLTDQLTDLQGRVGAMDLRRGDHQLMQKAAQEAEEEVARWEANTEIRDLDEAQEEAKVAQQAVQESEDDIAALRAKLADADAILAVRKKTQIGAEHTLERSKTAADRCRSCRKKMDSFAAHQCASDEEVASMREAIEDAKKALKLGARAQDALAQRENVDVFRKSAEERRKKAEQYRASADATGRVLSDSIPAGDFFIATNQRLMVNHPEQGDVPYHELSQTERWSRAIEVATDQVGEDGLIVIRQEAWEGIDVWTRRVINEHLVEKHVYALAAEATRDEEDGTEMLLRPYRETEVTDE